MRISVVIPLYNHAHVLPLCIRALLEQTRRPDEILIVNDASSDNGANVAAAFAEANDIVRVVHHDQNRGCPAALNTGLHTVSGDLVLFSAADDVVLPDLLTEAEQYFKAHPEAGLCCSEIALIDDANTVTGFRPPVLPRTTAGFISAERVRSLIRRSDNWLCGPSIVYHRQRLLDIGGYDEALGSLTDGLAARLLAFRHGFIFVPKVLATWRISPTSLSHSTAASPELEARNRDAASAWFARHADEIPDGYEALFQKRYRFGLMRLKELASEATRLARFVRMARLFARYRPMTPYLYILHGVRRARKGRLRISTIEPYLQRLAKKAVG